LWKEYDISIEEGLHHLRSKQHVQELDFLENLQAQAAMKEVMEVELRYHQYHHHSAGRNHLYPRYQEDQLLQVIL
jgi:hypothetical protein